MTRAPRILRASLNTTLCRCAKAAFLLPANMGNALGGDNKALHKDARSLVKGLPKGARELAREAALGRSGGSLDLGSRNLKKLPPQLRQVLR